MNRSVIIFAANSGLGLEVTRALLETGTLDTHVTYRRDGSALEQIYKEQGLDPKIFVHQVDLTSGDDVMDVLSAVAKTSRLWGIVNFAGTTSARRLSRMSWQESMDAFLGNAQPALITTQATLRFFAEHQLQGGRIIQMSSVITRRPVPGVVPYAAGKAAIEGIVRSSSLEAGAFGVTVNAIRLGYFDHGMTRAVPTKILDNVVASSAVQRLGTGDDLASLLTYLLDESSAFLTAAVIGLDGGLE